MISIDEYIQELMSLDESYDDRQKLEKIHDILNGCDDLISCEDGLSSNEVAVKHSPVRTLKDMTEEEIKAIEKLYGAKITSRKDKV